MPISVEGIREPLGVLSLTVTHDPTVLRAVNVVQGTHMQQGGVTTTFAADRLACDLCIGDFRSVAVRRRQEA